MLALGSRGDVQPLALLAWQLARSSNEIHVSFITHACHAAWLATLLPGLQLGPGLPHAPGTVWHGGAAAGAAPLSSNDAAAREAVVAACCEALHLTVPNPPAAAGSVTTTRGTAAHTTGAISTSDGESRQLGTGTLPHHCHRCNPHQQPCEGIQSQSSLEHSYPGPNPQGSSKQQHHNDCLIIFNLFCLEAYHIAEALGVRCLAAHPYLIPYSWPASFERRLAAACPSLHSRLLAASGNEEGITSWQEVGGERGCCLDNS